MTYNQLGKDKKEKARVEDRLGKGCHLGGGRGVRGGFEDVMSVILVEAHLTYGSVRGKIDKLRPIVYDRQKIGLHSIGIGHHGTGYVDVLLDGEEKDI